MIITHLRFLMVIVSKDLITFQNLMDSYATF